jgi:DNA-nicking Smr family endonuclease
MTKPDFSDMLERYLPDRMEARRREASGEGEARPEGPPARWRIEARCDLHGQTAEEARRTVDRFLKECAGRGLRKVLIIHGKGSGVLHKAVTGYLEGHPLAGQRESAPQAEGGRGALIVYLRQKKRAPDGARS